MNSSLTLIATAGFLSTYIVPLAFVLAVTMGKEAHDDYKRNQRDKEANSARYLILEPSSTSRTAHSTDIHDDEEQALSDGPHTRSVPSSKLRVGDLVCLEKNQRVPADMVLLRTSDHSGTCFIRTDQLDGETDWKLKVAVSTAQKLRSDKELLALDAEIYGMFTRIGRSFTNVLTTFSRCSNQGHPYLHWHFLVE